MKKATQNHSLTKKREINLKEIGIRNKILMKLSVSEKLTNQSLMNHCKLFEQRISSTKNLPIANFQK